MPFATVFGDASDDPSPAYEATEEPAPAPQPILQKQKTTPPTQQTSAEPFKTFTGKVARSKVRIRAQAKLDSPIVREMNKDDMFIVLDEVDDFYAIQPPAGTKAYIFRTFVLDNVVEGTKVNVRLEPDVDAPIIAQLNGGDHVEGSVSTLNSKWLEISPPSSTRFYVAKEYVEKIGDASLMAKIERRRDEVNLLLNSTALGAQKEMEKEFPDIDLSGAYANYNKVISSYADFPDQVARARDLLNKLQNDYMQKKIPYLEAKASGSSQMSEQMKTQQQKLVQLEGQLQKERANKTNNAFPANSKGSAPKTNNNGITDKMSVWMPVEQSLYETWANQNANGTQEDFYQEQSQKVIVLKGIVEPYARVVKNKPGDYVLMNQTSHLPIAFIYSTRVNLQDRVGQEITVYAAPRPNNNFAFPAYFVLGLE